MSELRVSHLQVWDSRTGQVLIPDLSFSVDPGSCLAIVGESGSGKSLACRSILRLHKPGVRQSGDIWLDETNLAKLSESEIRKMRGKRLCLIVQNGMRAFDPTRPVGEHFRETLAWHFGWGRDEITARMRRALESVLLKDPNAVMNGYPHELSGGMLQRAMIALALVLEPDIVIADEPTTALDTVSQFEVLEQLVALRERIGCATIFVTHDLGIVRRIADDMLVMKDGAVVERGKARDLFASARHEYTRRLVSAKLALNRHFDQLMGGGGDACHGQRQQDL